MGYGAGTDRRTMPQLPRPALAAQALLAAGLAASLSGCIVVARSADVYDPACKTTVKQVVLETEVVGAMVPCRNDGCLVVLASMGIISAASAVVAGSVAIVGNIAYWVERGGQCPADAPPPSRLAPAQR
ncbi:MAG: hypothetical protein RJA10_4018 [Pseudomonadota bacterium]